MSKQEWILQFIVYLVIPSANNYWTETLDAQAASQHKSYSIE